MLRGIDTVSGRDGGWYSAMDILTSSSSGSAVDVVGEEAVEDEVRIDNGAAPVLREFIMLLRSCLYTRRALFLPSLSRPSQEQH